MSKINDLGPLDGLQTEIQWRLVPTRLTPEMTELLYADIFTDEFAQEIWSRVLTAAPVEIPDEMTEVALRVFCAEMVKLGVRGAMRAALESAIRARGS